ncbi:hypothetical protein BFL28_12400 [Sphingomonas turrisvirgatae]|uniref:Uncharacterized protein n=2 Tax=Sphingomonas turrisvirgatae TaxID=1888892 RepID=A0A1E3LZ85_9SPHN|nr:hypothetical protein BFL28_12400 [Sphingomonas turrisvirgatae]
MVNWIVIASALLLPYAGAPDPGRAAASASLTGTRLAQVRIQQHVVIRVPRPDAVRRISAPAAPLPPIAWVEKDANKCVQMNRLAGAAITRPDSVDLVLAGGKRVRAKLGKECPALDFYSGFYVKPNKDGMVCAKRDTFRSRAGGECQIKQFRTLIPEG